MCGDLLFKHAAFTFRVEPIKAAHYQAFCWLRCFTICMYGMHPQCISLMYAPTETDQKYKDTEAVILQYTDMHMQL